MKKEDQMIDALLKEHSQKGASSDESFIQDVEKRLDKETERIHGRDRSGRVATWGLGMAAALTIGVVGYYGWKQEQQQGLVLNDEYVTSQPLPHVSKKLELQKQSLKASPKDIDGIPGSLLPADSQVLIIPFSNEKSSAERMITNRKPVAPSAPSASMAKVVGATRESYFGFKSGAVTSDKDKSGASDSLYLRAESDYGSYGFGDGWDSGSAINGGGSLGRSSKGGRKAIRKDMRRKRVKYSPVSGNRYGTLTDNPFRSPWKAPLSTFSVDVDTASYTNMRRMIQNGQSVPPDAVRIEEMINYFDYNYPQPDAKHPFSVNVETASCPWNTEHRLVKIGLQGRDIIREKRPSANLVFLLDVSGSMNSQDKLPLLVDSMKILLKELNGDDSVSIVVYAGAQGLALPPTYVDVDGRKTILKTLENLQSGGSTNGGSGIQLAYKVAKNHFVKGGVNRVILGTDGDFNVGTTDNASLISLVERKAKTGVFLSVLGFGQGNLNDSMLEDISNKGDGNYSYIDNLREGRKVFLDDMMGTMVTIAKDVKIQVEFNPAKVKRYRLIGYANRMLKAEDFKNKRIDAGEIGAGHTVTALYEIIPGQAGSQPVVDGLKYQKNKEAVKVVPRELVDSPEMLTVKLAYKLPTATKETESTYFNTPVLDSKKAWPSASDDFKFAAGVGLFGMLQRENSFAGLGDYTLVRKLAEAGRGEDAKGHRTEFSDLVRKILR